MSNDKQFVEEITPQSEDFPDGILMLLKKQN